LEKNTLPLKLSNRIEARTMTWDEIQKKWILKNVIVRNIISNEKIDTRNCEEMLIDLKINPKQLERINKKTNAMTFSELKEYILLLSAGGKDIRKMEIEYYAAQALPLANFIVILFAVSFASVKKRGGLAVQIAAAMVIVCAYLIFFQICKPIGLAMSISPIIVGWSANIIFIIC
jgi:lipopolysaccharide export LptBFGC system permease protein LptF